MDANYVSNFLVLFMIGLSLVGLLPGTDNLMILKPLKIA